ncbi:MAG: DUF2993 domain-containing protein [Actinomycetes bacterium]
MRKLIVAAVVVLALLFGLDRLTAVYASHRIATQLKQTEALSQTPSVTIHGFPLLTQVVHEQFQDVEVVVSDYTKTHVVTIKRIDVHLRHAHVNMTDALFGRTTTVPVQRVNAVVLIGYDALNRAHPALSFGYAGHGAVAVSGGIPFPGLHVGASITGHLTLNANKFSVGVGSFVVTTELPPLPFSFRLTSIRATSTGIEISGGADNVVLRQAGA